MCRHGEGHIYEYVETAIERGFDEIGFAEHIPIPGLHDPDGRMLIEEFPIYLQEIRDAQKKYSGITIRLGIEADFIPRYLDFVAKFLSEYPFDFVIGSVHFIDDWDFSHPDFIEKYHTFGIDETYKAYYNLLAEAASTGLFDVIGHFDQPKKFGHQPIADLTGEIENALSIIHEKNLVLDVNTAGKRKPVGEIYPSEDILRRAHELGIPVILGSDAHRPEDVGSHFSEARELLLRVGYKQQCAFRNREGILFPIE